MTDKKYPHIVYVEQETMGNSLNKALTIVRDQTTDLEGLLIFFPSNIAPMLPNG